MELRKPHAAFRYPRMLRGIAKGFFSGGSSMGRLIVKLLLGIIASQ